MLSKNMRTPEFDLRPTSGSALTDRHTETGKLFIPDFRSTEEAMDWGSHLNARQHAILMATQRRICHAALAEHDLQRMVELATRSQLLREAAEAFDSPPGYGWH